MHLQVPLIKPRKQWVRFSGMCLFIHFIISSHPPCSRVQKWHLFSQAHHAFFFFPPRVVVSNFSQTRVKPRLEDRPCLRTGKKWIFPPPLPCYSSLLKCSPFIALFCTNTRWKSWVTLRVWTNKLSWRNHATFTNLPRLLCKLAVYLCCLWAACGQDVYIVEWEASTWDEGGR